MKGTLVKRADKLAFYGVPGEGEGTVIYYRMKGFTEISISKNSKEYTRQYVDEAFEETIGLPDNVSGASVSAEVSVRETSYDISAEGVLTGKADIGVKLSVYSSDCIKAVTDILIDETTKKERDGDYAIKLYFGVENEDVWDIAKRYSTSVSAIMEENELSGERLENGGMLLIPIVS